MIAHSFRGQPAEIPASLSVLAPPACMKPVSPLGIVASWRMKIRRASSPSFVSEDVDLSGSPAKPELDEINDHPD